jgi:hypothetical protein
VSSLALSLISDIAIAWVAVSVVVAIAFGAVAARLSNQRRRSDRRRVLGDRRSGLADRRIGLPDTRAEAVERRRGTGDRRGGPGDRRAFGRRRPSVV